MRAEIVCFAASIAACAVVAGGVIAQETSSSVPEVRVQASRVIKKEVGRSSSTGAAIETAEITMRVSYADLRLDTNSGQALLRARVADAAKDACARLSPGPANAGTSDEECIRTATSAAKPQVDAAIATANPRR